LLVVCFESCSLGSFIGVYFNTYYNAMRLFSDAEDEIRTQQSASFKQGPQTYLPPFNLQSGTRTKLTSVIEKCSKLLQYHPESSLVDDALLLIGKAYYYQDENQKAERKFKELLQGYPESDLLFEAKLLLSKIYYKMNDLTEATNTAKGLLEEGQQSGNNEIVAEAATVLANIELNNKNYPQSVTYFRTAAERRSRGEESAAAYRKVAEVYQKDGQFAEAAEAYRRAEQAGGSYVSEYRARIGQARMLSKLGKPRDAMDVLEALRSNSNYREFYGEIELEIANTYNQMKMYAEAVAQYRYVDTAYARTEVSAKAYYELGLLYETKQLLYDSARVAYNKGRMEYPSSEITLLLNRRSEDMNRYASLRSQMANYDSMRLAILQPRPSSVDSGTIRQDSTLVRDSSTDTSKVAVKTKQTAALSIDSVESMRARTSIELAGFFYVNLGLVDSARFWYQRLLAEHPKSAYAARALYMLARIAGQDTLQGHREADSLYRALIQRFPDSEFAREAARFLGLPPAWKTGDEADQVYVRGTEMLAMGKDKAAIDSFLVVVHKYPSSPIASKAQYAVGWVYEEVQLKPDSALANYQRLVKAYPNSEYATRVKPKLAEVETKRKEAEDAARRDSIARAAPVRPSTSTVSPADSLEPSPTRLPLQKQLPDSTAAPLKKPDKDLQAKPREE
jgi:TolA-binding protein